MRSTKNGRKDAGIRLSDEVRTLLRDRAKARQMTQPEYLACVIREEAHQAKAQAMFAERNENDR